MSCEESESEPNKSSNNSSSKGSSCPDPVLCDSETVVCDSECSGGDCDPPPLLPLGLHPLLGAS